MKWLGSAAIGLALCAGSGAAISQAGAQVGVPPAQDYYPPKKRVSPYTAYEAWTKQSPDAAKPTPRLTDGKVDLNGVWGNVPSPFGAGGLRYPGSFEPDQAALQRASGWDKPLYKPEYWAKVRSLDFGKFVDDPSSACNPVGTPRQNAPSKIVQTGTEVVLIYPGLRTRVIPLNVKLTDEDMDKSTWDGVSSGHWDNDVLVIDSVGFNDISWLQWQGYFHTNMMKVTERIWRQGDLLFYNFTVDDPEVLVEPWTQGTLTRKLVRSAPDASKSLFTAGQRVDEADPCEVVPVDGDPYLRG